jgi:hypothetical protein
VTRGRRKLVSVRWWWWKSRRRKLEAEKVAEAEKDGLERRGCPSVDSLSMGAGSVPLVPVEEQEEAADLLPRLSSAEPVDWCCLPSAVSR